MTETPRKKTLFGIISYTMSVFLLVMLVGSGYYNWVRTKATLHHVARWAVQMQSVTVAQMHADRALALAELQTYRAEELEDAGTDLFQKLTHLQVEHMSAIMKIELLGQVVEAQAEYIKQLQQFIEENNLPTPALEMKECPPLPAVDESFSNSQRSTTLTRNVLPTFPGGSFLRNSTELDVSGMVELHEACPLNLSPGPQ